MLELVGFITVMYLAYKDIESLDGITRAVKGANDMATKINECRGNEE